MPPTATGPSEASEGKEPGGLGEPMARPGRRLGKALKGRR